LLKVTVNRREKVTKVSFVSGVFGFESIGNVYKLNKAVMDACVETLPTDLLDGFLSSSEDVRGSEDTRPVCWGRMFPLGSNCTAFGMLWSLVTPMTLFVSYSQ